jgi:hypothetical protein
MSERNYSTLTLSKSTLAKLKHMSKIFGKTEAMLVSEWIDAMLELTTAVDKATYWLDNSSITSQLIYTVITEKSHIISGEVVNPSCLGDRTNDILDEKTLQNEMDALASQSKIEKVKISQKNIATVTGEVKKGE